MLRVLSSVLLIFCLLACSKPMDSEIGSQALSGSGDFKIQNGSVTLAATLELPDSPGPHPVLIGVHGGGLGELVRRNFISLREFMVGRGVAMLTYDKRGSGESTGQVILPNVSNSHEVIGTLASDVVACVNFVKQHPQIDAKQIGIMGSSEGGFVCVSAASRSQDVSFMVIKSSSANSFGLVAYYQALTGVASAFPNGLNSEDAHVATMLERYDGPSGFDPLPLLESLSIPSLWILGGRDRHGPTIQSVAILENLIQDQNKPVTIKFYPNSNHKMYDEVKRKVSPFDYDVLAWFQRVVDVTQ